MLTFTLSMLNSFTPFMITLMVTGCERIEENVQEIRISHVGKGKENEKDVNKQQIEENNIEQQQIS